MALEEAQVLAARYVGRPLVLLDVDGVINAWHESSRRDAELVRLPTTTVTLVPETLRALRQLFTSGAEIVWCSSWRSRANEILPALEARGVIPPAAEFPAVTDGGDWLTDRDVNWKLDAVLGNWHYQAARAAGRPIYWIEDFGWLVERMWVHVPKQRVLEAAITAIDTLPAGYLHERHLRGHEEIGGDPWEITIDVEVCDWCGHDILDHGDGGCTSRCPCGVLLDELDT